MIINPYRFAAAGGITDPTDIAGLDLWLDASDADTLYTLASGGTTPPADDATTGRWEDKSGNANHAQQPTAGDRPLRRVAEVNGLDVLDFTAGPFMYGTANLTPRQTDAKSIFVVCKMDVSAATTSIFTPYGTDGATTGQVGLVTSEIAYRCSSAVWVSTDPCSTTAANIITLTQSGAGNIHDVCDMWLDGTNVTQTAGAGNNLALSDYAGANWGIGSGDPRSGGGSLPIDGKVCEIIVYDTELSASDRGDVETYLANKWGVTI